MAVPTDLRASQRKATPADKLPKINRLVLRFFRRIVRLYFRRHFRSVMVQGREHLQGRTGPLIVYGNHSSWWDPMISVLVASEYLPNERHYAPIDAAALGRYPILRRLGLFPVELDSTRGAVSFLRTAGAILASGGVLWITPQGRFADPRSPLVFRPGLGALAARFPEVPLVAMAVEYTFWDERLPEALFRLGAAPGIVAGTSPAVITDQLQSSLTHEMAALREASCQRDPTAFGLVLTGTRGSGGFYALGRRMRAWARGKRFEPDHTSR